MPYSRILKMHPPLFSWEMCAYMGHMHYMFLSVGTHTYRPVMRMYGTLDFVLSRPFLIP